MFKEIFFLICFSYIMPNFDFKENICKKTSKKRAKNEKKTSKNEQKTTQLISHHYLRVYRISW